MNHIVGKGGNSEIPSLNINNIEYETALEKANILNNTFAEKLNININDRLPPLLSLKEDSFLNRIKIRLRVVRKSYNSKRLIKLLNLMEFLLGFCVNVLIFYQNLIQICLIFL